MKEIPLSPSIPGAKHARGLDVGVQKYRHHTYTCEIATDRTIIGSA
jgi:hypothetical protein